MTHTLLARFAVLGLLGALTACGATALPPSQPLSSSQAAKATVPTPAPTAPATITIH
jgi:hypothetical protein